MTGSNISTPLSGGIGALVATAVVLAFNTYVAPFWGLPVVDGALHTVLVGIGTYLAARYLPPHPNSNTNG